MYGDKANGNMLSSNLRLLRLLANLTQEEAARALHMTRTNYVSIESGVRQVKSTDTILIAKLTDLTTSTLMHVDLRTQLRNYLKAAEGNAAETDFIHIYGQLSARGRRNVGSYIDQLIAMEINSGD